MTVESGAGAFGKAHLAGWIPTVTPSDALLFDTATTSAAALQGMLAAGEITSVQIVNECYRQILAYNGYLRAVYQLAPDSLDRARDLDAKRASGNVLGPLHGIPVLLKACAPRPQFQSALVLASDKVQDNVSTEASMKMDNTGGNLALVGSTAIKNAPIVDRVCTYHHSTTYPCQHF